MEALTARLENWDSDTFGSRSQAGLVGGLIEGYVRDVGLRGVVGGAGGEAGGGGESGAGQAGRDKERQADEEELSELSWKVGRLAEMFLSKEMQVRQDACMKVAGTYCVGYREVGTNDCPVAAGARGVSACSKTNRIPFSLMRSFCG